MSALTGEKRRLTRSPQGFYGDLMPAFSPDGRTLAFSRRHGFSVSQVYLLPLSTSFEVAGPPRLLTRQDQSVQNPVWIHDGLRILYLFGNLGSWPFELRTINVSGSEAPEPVPLAENNIVQLSLGRHLVYSRRSGDDNIWIAEIPPRESLPAGLSGP